MSDTSAPQPDGTSGLSPSNFALSDISDILANPATVDTGTGGTCTLSTDDGSWACSNSPGMTAPASKVITLMGGGHARIWVLGLLIVNEPVTIGGSIPAIWYIANGAELYGPITVSAGGTATGPGVGGGTAGSTTGGAGGSFCGVGGAGVPIAAGGNAAMPGASYGMPNEIPLVGGSAGGGTAGAGGGAFQVTCGGDLAMNFAGAVVVDGAPGGAAGTVGGGGGSGGSLLLEAATFEMDTGSVLSANGGRGGDPAQSGNDAAAGNGGASSMGATVNGTQGASAGAGGGGGAGRIQVNVKGGTPSVRGTLSPDTTTPCAHYGTLAT